MFYLLGGNVPPPQVLLLSSADDDHGADILTEDCDADGEGEDPSESRLWERADEDEGRRGRVVYPPTRYNRLSSGESRTEEKGSDDDEGVLQ